MPRFSCHGCVETFETAHAAITHATTTGHVTYLTEPATYSTEEAPS